jgi:hypothetical protein
VFALKNKAIILFERTILKTPLQHFISPRCNPTCEQIKLPDRLNSSQARLFPPLIRFRIRLSQQQESDVQFKTRAAQLFLRIFAAAQ